MASFRETRLLDIAAKKGEHHDFISIQLQTEKTVLG